MPLENVTNNRNSSGPATGALPRDNDSLAAGSLHHQSVRFPSTTSQWMVRWNRLQADPGLHRPKVSVGLRDQLEFAALFQALDEIA